MIAILFSPIGKALGIFALVIAALVGARIWLASHDATVREALVKSFEQQAAAAQAKEAERQAAAAKAATDALNAKLASAKAAEAAKEAIRESETIDYENRLKAAQRACLLDDSDLDAIVHIGQPADNRLGHH